MKKCFECGNEKPLDGFYKDRSKRDGLQSRCKSCTASRDRDSLENNRARKQAYRKIYNKLPHQKEAQSEWRAANKKKIRAHRILHSAIAAGKISPWSVCAIPECDEKPEAHHPSYDLPLDVCGYAEHIISAPIQL
jgi:hypothetical protein